jgi:hypothetical protein
MWPLGRPTGTGCAIPTRPARFLAGEGAEEGPWGSRAWFGCLYGVEVAGGGVLGGGGRRPALCVCFRRDRHLTEAGRGRVSYRGG